MPAQCVVIVNPAARSGRAGRQWPALSQQLEAAGCKHVTLQTQAPGEATRLCEAALRSGTTLVIAAGGDGTINEVVNGFFDQTNHDQLVAPAARLGILPLGTGSDFARTFGIRNAGAAIETLAAGASTLIDVGCVELQRAGARPVIRYFVNIADLGLGAETVNRVDRSPRIGGAFLSYLIGAVRSILAHRPSHISLRFDDGEVVAEPMSIVVMANNCYFGGGMLIAPDARPDDGLFDVLWLAGTSRSRLLVDLLPKVYRGAHLGHPLVRQRRTAGLSLESRLPVPLEIDGEQIGPAPATFRLLPRALRIVVPATWLAR